MQLTKNKLLEVIQEMMNSKVLNVYDFDDTLAHTDSVVKLKRSGQDISLDSHQFADYTWQQGDELDFSDFERVNGKIISNPLFHLNKLQKKGEEVIIITARPPEAIRDLKEFFHSNGMEAPPIYATAGSKGKPEALIAHLSKGNYSRVVLWEDSIENIEMLKATTEQQGLQFDAILIEPDTTMRKVYETNKK